MTKRIKTLEEVAKDFGEENIGIEKDFTAKNGYFIPHIGRGSRNGKGDFQVIDSKVHVDYNFTGRNQPVSFGYFKSQSGYNAKLKLTSPGFQNHLGEYLGFLILGQLDKKVCKVDIGTAEIKKKYSGETVLVPGCLSHSQTNSCESFKSMAEIAEDFRYSESTREQYKKLAERGKTDSNKNNINIEVVLAAMESLYKANGQEDKISELRKSIFDMCMFDIKFANRDRHDDNFGLKINQRTGELKPYPLFDNEQILGFSIREGAAAKAMNSESKSYKNIYNGELSSYIGYPGNISKTSPIDLFEYLLQNYYDEFIESYRDFSRYTISDLNNVMDKIPGISEAHKSLARNIYLTRQNEIFERFNKVNSKRIEEGKEIVKINLENNGHNEGHDDGPSL